MLISLFSFCQVKAVLFLFVYLLLLSVHLLFLAGNEVIKMYLKTMRIQKKNKQRKIVLLAMSKLNTTEKKEYLKC